MKNGNITLGGITKTFKASGRQFARHRAFLFFVLLAVIYSYIIFSINDLSGVSPDQATLSQASSSTTQPHIDPKVVQKLQSLQDNSVNVQTLFDQARQNPFQE